VNSVRRGLRRFSKPDRSGYPQVPTTLCSGLLSNHVFGSDSSSSRATLRGVALLTLANPEQRNAMSPSMTASWASAVDEIASDPTVRAVVVTGEGTAFCSGGDTSWLAGEPTTPSMTGVGG